MKPEQFDGIILQESTIRVTEDTKQPLILAHGGKMTVHVLSGIECELIQLAPAELEINLGCQARLTHYAAQGGSVKVTQQQDSSYSAVLVNTNTPMSQDLEVKLQEEGSEADIIGLLTADGTDKVRQQIRIEHAASHTRSNQYVKSIANERGEITMHARIVVNKNVKQVQATQLNKNMLLSDQALVHAEPWLEIDSDDVQVAHGSATGQLDQEQLAYLTSRGIETEQAQTMLKQAFIIELAELIANDRFRSLVLEQTV